MTPRFLKLTVLLAVFALQTPAGATHIAGGEITYKYLDSNTYLVRLTMFVDCYNGSHGAISLDSTAIIAYYDASGYQLINYDEIRRSQPTRIYGKHYNCVKFTTDACVDQYIYEYEKTIDPGDNGVIIAFQRCCRNGTITNIVNPQDVGATYWAFIPPDTVVQQNSSPYFTKLPPNFLCTNAPLIFDHSAIDPDGDSLVYSLDIPYNGANRFNPRPVPPSSPPFANIVYLSPYSGTNMMGTKAALRIHPVTGELRVTPELTGQFVVGIKVSEYRNGRLISETLRDYQFNVYACEFETQANFINPERVCKDTVYFTDQSTKATYYYWDFGIDYLSNDTSHQVNPFWTYPDNGNYKVTLIVGNQDCLDTFYNYVTIVHADSIHAQFEAFPTSGCDELNLCVTNTSDETPDWYWDWGDGSPVLHNINPDCHLYDKPGKYYPAITIIDSAKCNISDIYTTEVEVFDKPIADFVLDKADCEGRIWLTDRSSGSTGNYWYMNGLDSTIYNETQTEVKYNSSGDYTIYLYVSNGNCTDTAEMDVTIDLENVVSAQILPKTDPGCAPVLVHFTAPTGKTGFNIWDMGDGVLFTDTMLSSYLYTKPGTYTIKYTVTDTSSCNIYDEMEFTITISGQPEADFFPEIDNCFGKVRFINESTGGSAYLWNFGDGSYAKSTNPEHLFTRAGSHTITLTVDTPGPCPATIVKSIDLQFAGLHELVLPNIFTPNADQLNDCYLISGVNTGCYDYTFIVYNRWGEKVFETNDMTACWNGATPDGTPYPAGTYFSIFQFRESGTDQTHKFSGTITLIR